MRIKKNTWYLIGILAFALVLRIIFFSGAGYSDSMAYYHYAYDASQGQFELTANHFSSRIGLIYVQSALYSAFGVNDISSNILMVVSSLVSIIVIYLLGVFLFDKRVGLIASFLLAIFPLDVIFASRLMPDFPSAMFMALAVLLFLYAEKNNSLVSYVGSGISWGAAYLFKEITVLLGLFFFVYVVVYKKFRWQYLVLGAFFVASILIELAMAASLTGDPFARFHQIQGEEIAYLELAYSSYFTPLGMLARLFIHWPFTLFADFHIGLVFIFVIIALVFVLVKKRTETMPLLIWLIPLALYLNFGPISLNPYVPIPVTAKFISLIMIPSFLILAYYLALPQNRKLFTPTVLIILLATSIGYITLTDDRHAIAELRSTYDFLEDTEKPLFVDERSFYVLEYLDGFENNLQMQRFNTYGDLGNDPEFRISSISLDSVQDSYVVVNTFLTTNLQTIYTNMKLPEEISNIPEEWQVVHEAGSGNKKITVYYVP